MNHCSLVILNLQQVIEIQIGFWQYKLDMILKCKLAIEVTLNYNQY